MLFRLISKILTLILLGVFVQSAPVVDFQVSQPLTLPADAQQCTVEILTNTFANSYGHAAVVQYTPPTDCGAAGTWAGISLNLTVTSNGTQYDRLGTFTLHDVEIWRTSTPEPISGDGIIWTYLKDVTHYLPLFAEAGTFILELDNVVEVGLDGEYAATVLATFYESSDQHPTAIHSDLIISLGSLSSDEGAQVSVPSIFSTNVTVPQNAVQIFAELYASGNGDEEFWYYNAANQFFDDLPSGTTYGNGPFREVRLLVDGQLAGIAFPYPVLFTGAILPNAWMPITSYGALDLPTYFLDLTAFVPVLTDGNSHNISIDVSSAESDHAINSNWFVSGNLQVVTDSSGLPTTGNITVNNAPDFATTNTSGDIDGGLGTITVDATHNVHIESTIVSGSGETTLVVFDQSLQYHNEQFYTDSANNVIQTASGTVLSTHNGVAAVSDTFSFPFAINLTNANVAFDHSYNRTLVPNPFITGSTIVEHQIAGGGSTSPYNNNTFSYSDLAGNTFEEEVDAVSNSVVSESTGGTLSPTAVVQHPALRPVQSTFTFAPARFPGSRHVLQQRVGHQGNVRFSALVENIGTW